MPWEKSFDTDEVLDNAMSVFWAKGYEVTSMSDLIKATGINKGSLYNAFGSKKALFREAFLKYEHEQRQAKLTKLTQKDSPVEAIETLFDMLVDQSVKDEDKKGCLLVNTAVNLPHHDADIEVAVLKGMTDYEVFFKDQLTLAKLRGEVKGTLDVNRTAKGLLALVVGLRVLARGVFERSGLEDIRDHALGLVT